MKFSLKLIISFSLLYILVPFLLIFPFYGMSSCAKADSKKENLAYNYTINNSIKEIYDIPYYTGKDADSVKHKLNLFLPEGVKNPPIMLWIHGGAWAFGDRKLETRLARNFAKEGIAIAVMSYRLSPATWRDPKWDTGVVHPAHIKDVAHAFSWVYDNAKKYKYDKHSIFVSGFSAGAHLSALLAMDPTYLTEVGRSVRDIKAVIPIAGAYDMVSYYNTHLKFNGKAMADSHVKGVFGNAMESIRKASPTEYINNQWVPQLVISETDTYDYTLLLEKAAQKANYKTMEFYHVKDKNHAGLSKDLSNNDFSPYKKLIVDYIKKKRANYTYLDRSTFKLAYKTFGKGDPLFLLNGGPGFSSHNFKKLAKKIASKTQRQVILFDQRGTGYSEIENPTASNITLDLMIDDLEALRKHLGFKEISLMGQSFGGIYAMAYTAKYPEKVTKIVLSHSGGMNMDFMEDVSQRLTSRIANEDRQYLNTNASTKNPDLSSMLRSKAIAPGYVFNKEKSDLVYKGLAFNSRFYPKINQLVWQDMRKNYNVSNSMRAFDKPVLVIHGDHDIVNPEHAKRTHQTFPNSKFILLENCVHYGWIDRPELYFQEVFKFLSNRKS